MPRKRKPVRKVQPRDAIVPEIQRMTVINPAGKVIRAPIAERASWADPDDKNDRSKTPRQVLGFRRTDPLLTLHRRNESEITSRHIRVCERYRDDFEISQGANSGGDLSGVRGTSSPGGPTEAQMKALQSYRLATQAVGISLGRVLVMVVLGTSDLTAYAESVGISVHVAKGYLIAALDRLADHYEPTASGRLPTRSFKSA